MPTSFISHLLQHTLIYESPSSFWRWAGYASIASILRDNVYKKHGDNSIYANIYVLLLADSAVQRKGRPIELAESIVRKLNNTKIISGRASIQAILDELGRVETDKNTGVLVKGGAATFFAAELSAGIVSDPGAIAILTDIYDYKENYKEHLRGRGNSEINKIVFTMFAGSNEALLKDVYDIKAIHGGLLGRTFIIKPDEFRKGSSLTKELDTSASFKQLVEHLNEIRRNVVGEMKLGELAALEYDNWYLPFRESYRTKNDNSGIAGRLHTNVLKLAMILAANDHSLMISKQHIEASITECMSLVPNYKSFLIAGGKSDLAAAGGILIEALLKASEYRLSRKMVLREHWQDISSEDLEKITIQLDQAGVISIEQSGSDVAYRLTEKALEEMKVK